MPVTNSRYHRIHAMQARHLRNRTPRRPTARLIRIGIFALVLVACDYRATLPVAPVGTSSVVSGGAADAGAPVMIDPAPTDARASAVTFAAYANTGSGGWAVGIEMAQTVTRVVILDRNAFTKPLSLLAKPGADGGFEASAYGIQVRGNVAGGTLRATIDAFGTSRFTAAKATPPATFDVIFGGAGLRVDWRQSNGKVTALVQQLAQPKRKLEGEVKDAVFELTEKGEDGSVVARLDGALLDEHAALARWTTHGVSQAVTLDSAVVSLYPDVLTLPNGTKIAPAEDYDTTDGCVTDGVFPQVSNVPTEAALNEALAKQFRLIPGAGSRCHPMECWDVASYAITGHGDDWVSFEMQSYAYRGGTHGGGASRCSIASLVDASLVSLAKELPASSLKKLEPLARAALLKGSSAKSITDLGFVSEDLMIDAERPMCVRASRGNLFLEITYGDDEGMFRISGPPRARVPAWALRGLFPAGTVGKRIFH
jgi:hypothetical protein